MHRRQTHAHQFGDLLGRCRLRLRRQPRVRPRRAWHTHDHPRQARPADHQAAHRPLLPIDEREVRPRSLSPSLTSGNRDLDDQTSPRRSRPRPLLPQRVPRTPLARPHPQHHNSCGCSGFLHSQTTPLFQKTRAASARAAGRKSPPDPAASRSRFSSRTRPSKRHSAANASAQGGTTTPCRQFLRGFRGDSMRLPCTNHDLLSQAPPERGPRPDGRWPGMFCTS